jgi:hypothetical protein
VKAKVKAKADSGALTWALNFVAARDIQQGEPITFFALSYRRGFE